MTGADKREHKRAAIPLLIQYRFSPFERYETDYSANISAGGLFIHCDQPPANVSTILLRFLPRDGSRVILAQGEVRERPSGQVFTDRPGGSRLLRR